MKDLLRKIDAHFVRVMNGVIIAASLSITALILFLVISRVFGWSVVGMLELATISAMWLYMCGAIVAVRNKEHLTVTFVSQRLTNPRAIARHDLVVSIIMMGLGIFFIDLAIDMYDFASRRPQTTPALSLPLLIPQSAIFFGAAFMAVYTLRDLVLAVGAFFATHRHQGG